MWYHEAAFRETDDGYLYFANREKTYQVTPEKKAQIVGCLNRSELFGIGWAFVTIAAFWWFGGLDWMISFTAFFIIPIGALLGSVYTKRELKRILIDARLSDERRSFSAKTVREGFRLMPWWEVGICLGIGLCGIGACVYFGYTSYWDFLLKTLLVVSCAVIAMAFCFAALKLRYR